MKKREAKLKPMNPVKAWALVRLDTNQFVRLTTRCQSENHRLVHVEIKEIPCKTQK